MWEILAAWVACGFVITLFVGLILELAHNLGRLQTAILSWLVGNAILVVGTFWVLSQDPVPFAFLRDWREELVRRIASDRAILLRDLPHPQLQPVAFTPLDTDDDGQNEWLALYAQEGSRAVRGFVLDTDVGFPGVLYPYPLRTPHEDYLGERGVEAELANVVGTARPELIVSDGQTLSLFRVNDRP